MRGREKGHKINVMRAHQYISELLFSRNFIRIQTNICGPTMGKARTHTINRQRGRETEKKTAKRTETMTNNVEWHTQQNTKKN